MKMFGNLLKLYGYSWKPSNVLVVAVYIIQFTLTAYALGSFEHAADNA